MGGKTLVKGREILVENNVPTFTFPESAVAALQGMVRYAHFRAENDKFPSLPPPTVDRDTVKATFYDVLKDRRVLLLAHESSKCWMLMASR